MNVPRSRQVQCEHCGYTLDSRAPGVYQHIEGWARNRTAGGTNTVQFAVRHRRWLCAACIETLRHGEQLTLF